VSNQCCHEAYHSGGNEHSNYCKSKRAPSPEEAKPKVRQFDGCSLCCMVLESDGSIRHGDECNRAPAPAKRDEWPPAVSDGLTIPCHYCRVIPLLDYRIEDEVWELLVPKAARRGVVCLECLYKLAIEQDVHLARHVLEIQIASAKCTTVFKPETLYEWDELRRALAQEESE
jgi:hypothetical protein